MKKLGLLTIILLALNSFSFAQTPKTWEEWRTLAFQQSQKKDYETAIMSFSECIRLKSNAAECYSGRGMLYQTKKNYEPAISDLTKALELYPNDEGALISLAECYNDVKKYDLAISTATKGITLFSNQPKALLLAEFYHVRALANYNLKKYQDAIADATKALNIGGKFIRENDTGQTYFVRSLAYCRTGEYDLAVYDEKKAQELGRNIDRPCEEADSLLAAGKPIDIIAISRRSGASLHILNGLGAKVDGNTDKAIADFTKAIETAPKSPDGYFERASLYFNYTKQYQLAKADIEQALKLNPNHEEAAELKKQIEEKLGISSTPVAKVGETVLFFDDFDDNRNNWSIGNNDLAEAVLTGGRKTMELKQQTFLKTLLGADKSPKIDQTRDFLIETQLTFLSGDDRHPFGMIWGAKDFNNVFNFGIYSTGKFYYGKSAAGGWYPVVADTPSPAIKTGIGATNKLGVRKRGDKIEFYINNILVSTQQYEPFIAPASIGFSLNFPKKISADYFKVVQFP